MKNTICNQIDEDLQGYLEAEEDPTCVTEYFDLQGKKVDIDGE